MTRALVTTEVLATESRVAHASGNALHFLGAELSLEAAQSFRTHERKASALKAALTEAAFEATPLEATTEAATEAAIKSTARSKAAAGKVVTIVAAVSWRGLNQCSAAAADVGTKCLTVDVHRLTSVVLLP
jgi:hypothetical protein